MEAFKDTRPSRGPKDIVSPWRPNGWMKEEERLLDRRRVPALTVFLAGSECPFSCIFCDLWRQTLDGPTPPQAIPRQIETVLQEVGKPTSSTIIKLYNSSNFFDPRAVPPQDDPKIADLVRPFENVIVESHPQFIGRRCIEFAKRLSGSLEVAIGLETAAPRILAQLNKGMTIEHFIDAAAKLRDAEIGLRVFLFLPPPFVPESEVIASLENSVAFAAEHGARHISLIPTRVENGSDHAAGLARPPSLTLIEDILDRCKKVSTAVVTVDLWNIEDYAPCSRCSLTRIDRLHAINLGAHSGPRLHCASCMS